MNRSSNFEKNKKMKLEPSSDRMDLDIEPSFIQSTEEIDANVLLTPSANSTRVNPNLKQLPYPQNQYPALQPTGWNSLPNEIRYHIIAQFDPASLRSGAQVSLEWNVSNMDTKKKRAE